MSENITEIHTLSMKLLLHLSTMKYFNDSLRNVIEIYRSMANQMHRKNIDIRGKMFNKYSTSISHSALELNSYELDFCCT